MKVSDSLSLSLFKRDIRQHLKRGDGGADHGDKHEGHVRETSPGHVRRSLGEETKWRPLEQQQKLARSLSFSLFPSRAHGLSPSVCDRITPLCSEREELNPPFRSLISNKTDVRIICA